MTAAAGLTDETSTNSARWIGRAAWSVGSQGLSSATNFGLTAALMVVLSADELGRTLSLLSVYLLALTLARALVSEPMVASAGDDQRHRTTPSLRQLVDGRRLGRATKPGAFPIAALAAVGSVLVALALGVDRQTTLVVVVTMPVLLLQDERRYRAMAADDHRSAAVIDGFWLLVSAVALLAWATLGSTQASTVSGVAVVGSWALGGVASWALGVVLIAATPVSDPASEADQRSPGDPNSNRYRVLAHSQVVLAIAFNLSPLLVATALSPTLAAAAKAVLIPFTIILSLHAGLRAVTLPAIRAAIDGVRDRSLLPKLLGGLTAATIAGSTVMVGTIAVIGPATFGPSLALVSPYLPLGAVLCVFYIVAQQLADAVALSGGANAFTLRVGAVAVEWVGLIGGGLVAGTTGMMVGWTVGLGLATAMWLLAWLRRPHSSQGG